MFKLLKQTEGHARRGELITPHGTAQTPAFMNVGTVAAIYAVNDVRRWTSTLKTENEWRWVREKSLTFLL